MPAFFPSADLFDAIVLYGAPWSVYDTATIGSWVGDEIAFARSAVSLGVPVLGICFGGQLLAAALGGSVAAAPTPGDRLDPGLRGPVRADRAGAVVLLALRPVHGCRRRRPVLSRTAAADQAFCAGRSLGLQFHPEVDEEVLDALAPGRRVRAARPGSTSTPRRCSSRPGSWPGAAAARTAELVRRFVDRRRPAAGGAAAGGAVSARRAAMRRFSHRRGSDAAGSQA